MQNTVLITGANRGIGLEFVKHYAQKNWRIYACCRNPESADNLKEYTKTHKNITLLKLDITQQSDIDSLAAQLQDKTIDLLINNAGIYGKRATLGNVSVETMKQVFLTNTVAPLKLSEALLPSILKSQGKTILTLSSRMGSIADNDSGNSYAYRASKTALNSVMKSLAIDTRDQGIKVIIMHPGWVKTDMGGENALITPEESVKNMVSVLEKTTLNNSGCFFHSNGQELPW